jgi:hypothetical protein
MSVTRKRQSRHQENLPLDGLESLSATPKVISQCNIVQDIIVTVQGGVYETNRSLSDCSSLLINLKWMSVLDLLILNNKKHTKVKTEANSGEAKLEP